MLNGFKTAGYTIISIAQGQTDRNHVYANIGKVNFSDSSTSSSSGIFIRQAITESIGAMRMQQVFDVNVARKNVTEPQKHIADASNLMFIYYPLKSFYRTAI